MRIAFICKRQYMGKDVIVDRYARLYEIPFQLARLGHEVRGFCLSYQRHETGEWKHDAAPGSLVWESRSLGRLLLPALAAYPVRLLRSLRDFAPDLLIGASDAPHVALTRWLARVLRVPYAVDLYDNFESFGLTRLPGLKRAYRKAIGEAAVVTCTSIALARHVRDVCAPRGTVAALPSTVDLAIFHRGDRAAARLELALPESARLVGTAGGLLGSRGIGTLYAAFEMLSARFDDVHLILAGPIDRNCPPPTHPRVRHLGMLPHARVARLFQALDVGVIYLRDTPFGRYCFPQKAYEMLACGLPLAAANVGEMPHLLQTAPRSLYAADDAASLAACIDRQLADPQIPHVEFGDWAALAGQLNELLMGANRRGG